MFSEKFWIAIIAGSPFLIVAFMMWVIQISIIRQIKNNKTKDVFVLVSLGVQVIACLGAILVGLYESGIY